MTALKSAATALAVWVMTAGAALAQQGTGTPLTPDQLNAEAYANAVIRSYSYFNGGMAADPLYADSSWSDALANCGDARPAPGAKAPRVVRVKPAAGSTVRPGAMVVSVTFDQEMACRATLAAGSPFPVPCPGDRAAVIVAHDRRTFTTVCQVAAGASYSMPIADFVSAHGVRSERYDLQFTTADGAPVTDARAALAMEKAGTVQR